MNKLLSIISFLVIICGSVLLVIGVIESKKILSCYDAQIVSFDDIEFRSRTQGWSEKRICELKQDSILTLGTCLSTLEEESHYPSYMKSSLYSTVIRVVSLIRPGLTDVPHMKTAHDERCAGFPSTQFEVWK